MSFDTIFDMLLYQFESKENNIAIQTRNRTIKYKELLYEILQDEIFFVNNGIRKGDRVVILLNNGIEFARSFFALNKIKAIVIPIYVNLGNDKLQKVIDYYKPDFIVSCYKYTDKISGECIELNDTLGVFSYDMQGGLDVHKTDKKKIRETYIDEQDVAMILSTSGTTSDPKGIMLTDSNIVYNTTEIAKYMNVVSDDRILMIKSINHSSSITGEFLVGMLYGCTLHVYEGVIHARMILQYIVKYRISIFFAVPSIIVSMLSNDELRKFDLGFLRIIHFYGAVMQKKDMENLITCCKNSEIIFSYGLTEAAPRVTYAKKDKLLLKLATSGQPLPGIEISIKVDRQNVGIGQIGEIVIKGPNVMRGYFGNKELTQKVLIDGELYTGDLGYLDKDGDLFVLGRKDNMFIKHGRNVHPEEIEGVICSIDDIVEALVIGKDEKITAYIVSNSEIEAKTVIDCCRRKLEDYKVPDFVVQVDELRKNANNKIIRNTSYTPTKLV